MISQYQLCFYSGSLTGKIFPIEKEETKIGRDASCDIILTENSVSRIHVFLYVQQNGAVVLVDNNSTNGTSVNNIQISAPVQLTENDVISLGGEVMMVFQKVAGFEPDSPWNGADMPAGNAPESFNFERKQGNPMNNDNNNYPNDGAVSGYNSGASVPPENFGFNQAYNTNFNSGTPEQAPYGYGDADANPASSDPLANSAPAQMDFSSPVSGQPGEAPAQQAFENNPYSQQQVSGQQNPYAQQQNFGQQQMGFGNNPYSQQQNFGQPQQMGFGNDPYAQQQNFGQPQQMGYGQNPYGQQNPYGNNPYGQQGMVGQMPEEEAPQKSNKKVFIILAITLLVVILIGAFIFYVDSHRLWCDFFPFLWDANTCAAYASQVP